MESSRMMMVLASMLVALTVLAFLPHASFARVFELRDSVTYDTDFQFVGKFAYGQTSDDEQAKMTLLAQAPLEGEHNIFALYDNEDTWLEVYDSDQSCSDKLGEAAHVYHMDQTTGTEPSFFAIKNATFAIEKDSYWFMAVVNCDKGEIEMTSFTITFLQGSGSQFSLEEYGLLALYSIYFIVYLVLVAIQLYGMWVLSRSKEVHPLFMVYSMSLMFQFVAVMFFMAHWAKYKNNGIGNPGSEGFAEFCEFLSETFFFILILLIGRGWTITYRRVQQRYVVFGTLVLYITLYLVFYIYTEATKDVASTRSDWLSIPAILLLTFRCLAWVYFLYSIRVSYRAETVPQKLRFYRIFGIVYSIWFIIWPFFVAICSAMDSTNQEKALVILFETVTIFAQSAMVYILWPSKAHKLFSNPRDMESGAKEPLPYSTIS